MTPREQLAIQAKRLESWMNRNGMNEHVNEARQLATRHNATRPLEDQLTPGLVMLAALLDGMADRRRWLDLDEKVTTTLSHSEKQTSTKPEIDRNDYLGLPHAEDDDQPFDL